MKLSTVTRNTHSQFVKMAAYLCAVLATLTGKLASVHIASLGAEVSKKFDKSHELSEKSSRLQETAALLRRQANELDDESDVAYAVASSAYDDMQEEIRNLKGL